MAARRDLEALLGELGIPAILGFRRKAADGLIRGVAGDEAAVRRTFTRILVLATRAAREEGIGHGS